MSAGWGLTFVSAFRKARAGGGADSWRCFLKVEVVLQLWLGVVLCSGVLSAFSSNIQLEDGTAQRWRKSKIVDMN